MTVDTEAADRTVNKLCAFYEHEDEAVIVRSLIGSLEFFSTKINT